MVKKLIQLMPFIKAFFFGYLLVISIIKCLGKATKHSCYCQIKFMMAIKWSWIKYNCKHQKNKSVISVSDCKKAKKGLTCAFHECEKVEKTFWFCDLLWLVVPVHRLPRPSWHGQCISVMYLRLKQLGDQVTWNTSATHNIEALGLDNGLLMFLRQCIYGI